MALDSTIPTGDLDALARRLDLVAHTLATTSALARRSYAQVGWTDDARQEVDARLALLDGRLEGLIVEVAERARTVRSMAAEHSR